MGLSTRRERPTGYTMPITKYAELQIQVKVIAYHDITTQTPEDKETLGLWQIKGEEWIKQKFTNIKLMD